MDEFRAAMVCSATVAQSIWTMPQNPHISALCCYEGKATWLLVDERLAQAGRLAPLAYLGLGLGPQEFAARFKAATTSSCSASVICTYIGKETLSRSANQALGKSPGAMPYFWRQ